VSASQRRKGATGERAIANALKPTFPDAKRGIGQARAGAEVPDVDGVPGIWIEVKRRKAATTSTILDALTQASIATDGRTPVVVVQSDREHPIACMRLEDWAALVAKANAANDVDDWNDNGLDPTNETCPRPMDGSAGPNGAVAGSNPAGDAE
jgi:hypothetical protein